jgi:hypothetical protein
MDHKTAAIIVASAMFLSTATALAKGVNDDQGENNNQQGEQGDQGDKGSKGGPLTTPASQVPDTSSSLMLLSGAFAGLAGGRIILKRKG